MKILRVAYKKNGRILAIGKVTSIPTLLQVDERNDILKAFAYWVMQKFMGFSDENKYGTLKRELQNFNKKLFRSLRAIAGRITQQIKIIIY